MWVLSSRIVAACTILWLIAPGTPPTLAAERGDPFPLRNQLPFNLVFLDMQPAAARVLPAGDRRLSLHVAYENTFAATDDLVRLMLDDDFAVHEGRVTSSLLETIAAGTLSRTAFVIDGETSRAVLDGAFGVGGRVEVGISVPIVSHGGGFLDPIIDGYHERLDLPDGGRPGFARNRLQMGYVGDGESIFFDDRGKGAGLGDAVVSARMALTPDSAATRVAATLALKAPTGDPDRLFGSGSFDYGAALHLTRATGRSTWHAGYGYVRLGAWDLAPRVPLRHPRSAYLALTYRTTSRADLVVQILRTSGAFHFRSGGDLGKAALEIAAGFRHHLAGGGSISWGMLEDLDGEQNTPDVGGFLAFDLPPAGRGSRP